MVLEVDPPQLLNHFNFEVGVGDVCVAGVLADNEKKSLHFCVGPLPLACKLLFVTYTIRHDLGHSVDPQRRCCRTA